MIQPTTKAYNKELAQNIANCLADGKTRLPGKGKELVITGQRVYHKIQFCSAQEYKITLNIPS